MSVTQQEFLDGLRGMPILGSGTDGLQGTPDRTKGTKKSRGGNKDGWSDFDVKASAALGRTVREMNAARVESRAFFERLALETIEDLFATGYLDTSSRDRLVGSVKAGRST